MEIVVITNKYLLCLDYKTMYDNNIPNIYYIINRSTALRACELSFCF